MSVNTYQTAEIRALMHFECVKTVRGRSTWLCLVVGMGDKWTLDVGWLEVAVIVWREHRCEV